ncbi:cell division ATP-binding protein FtsE [Thioalkalivibrio sp. XN8]|uniref:cell division ATP-binding protein FtsE n=1 Tax=Thioalkalivibrio sp. XN8 TaxID=2712863 RepID=UPI0013EAD686|nr:cell division ATP-binding protein FtsE [Thioalkalivibrio sp. XN8]
MIRFEQVFKRYPGGRDALRDLSLRIAEGEMVFLTGHSGAGKSTLLKLIACIERPTRGQVLIGGRNTAGISRRQVPAHRRRIGMVFQDHKLLADRTVFDNVGLPLVIAGVGTRETGRRVRAALDQVGLLGKEGLPPVMLSQGEQQRVGIARAIAARPPLLIADEPTGNLDPDLSLEIMYLFARLNRVGTTVLVASHDLPLLERMGHRRIALGDGRLIEDLDHAFPGAPPQ